MAEPNLGVCGFSPIHHTSWVDTCVWYYSATSMFSASVVAGGLLSHFDWGGASIYVLPTSPSFPGVCSDVSVGGMAPETSHRRFSASVPPNFSHAYSPLGSDIGGMEFGLACVCEFWVRN
jgi:hypothetical protein